MTKCERIYRTLKEAPNYQRHFWIMSALMGSCYLDMGNTIQRGCITKIRHELEQIAAFKNIRGYVLENIGTLLGLGYFSDDLTTSYTQELGEDLG